MTPEEHLIHSASNGDNSARHELYIRYLGYVMALALRYVADRDIACDVLQDCFVQVFTSLHKFSYRGEGSFKAWIHRIAVNMSLGYLRNESHNSVCNDLPDVPDDTGPDMSRVPMEEIMRMIGMLPTGYRTVFNLYVLEQKSHKEIAAMLDIGESTSASQYLRARKMLARMVKDYENKH